MRYFLDLGTPGTFYFEDLSDVISSLHVVDAIKPFESDVSFKAAAIEGDDSIVLVITGIKFPDYISFGLDDESRRAYDKFVEKHRTLV